MAKYSTFSEKVITVLVILFMTSLLAYSVSVYIWTDNMSSKICRTNDDPSEKPKNCGVTIGQIMFIQTLAIAFMIASFSVIVLMIFSLYGKTSADLDAPSTILGITLGQKIFYYPFLLLGLSFTIYLLLIMNSIDNNKNIDEECRGQSKVYKSWTFIMLAGCIIMLGIGGVSWYWEKKQKGIWVRTNVNNREESISKALLAEAKREALEEQRKSQREYLQQQAELERAEKEKLKIEASIEKHNKMRAELQEVKRSIESSQRQKQKAKDELESLKRSLQEQRQELKTANRQFKQQQKQTTALEKVAEKKTENLFNLQLAIPDFGCKEVGDRNIQAYRRNPKNFVIRELVKSQGKLENEMKDKNCGDDIIGKKRGEMAKIYHQALRRQEIATAAAENAQNRAFRKKEIERQGYRQMTD